MDKFYQNIKVIDELTKKVTFKENMVHINYINFDAKKIYINYETELDIGTISISKYGNKLIIY